MSLETSPSSTLRASASLETGEKTEEDNPVQMEGDGQPTRLQLGLITTALCLSVFLVALDNTIIATAIPKITHEFHSLDDVGWYASSYLLTSAAFQLFFARLYTLLSVKWVYISAICIFELGSLICMLAPSSDILIVGRAIAGLGSAAIFSGALIIVANVVPLTSRPVYSGCIASMYGIASVAAPLLGGIFTDKVSFRWCFGVNLPVGGITLVMLLFFFKPPAGIAVRGTPTSFAKRLRRLDPLGTALFLPSIISILLALQWGGTKYAWTSPRIITLIVVFAVLITAFVAVQLAEKDQDNVTLPPRIISQRSMLCGAWFAFFAGGGFYVLVYFVPIWFQAIKGDSAVQSGTDNLALILSLVMGTLVAGAGVTLLGYYVPFMLLSGVLMPIGAGLISTFTVDAGHAEWMGYQVIFGFGAGLGMQQPFIAAQTVLETADVPTGTSLLVFLQTLGGALFVSVGETIFSDTLVRGLIRAVPTVDPHMVLNTGATSLRSSPSVNPDDIDAVLRVYNSALAATFHLAIVLVGLSLFGALGMEWRNIRREIR
ncbi:Major facilitator superfamily transporter [Mycena chlorophos]|uniref:Major facilitator superfamily transporter n=1 Tax=Mycena chlorophos TaxID=658473 RepID=A0A8H6WHS5_MYCCL|nr:Major facilitator superfamily transporter [Mycena chlorophos]